MRTNLQEIYLFNIHDKPIVVCAYLLNLYVVGLSLVGMRRPQATTRLTH